MDQSLVVNLRPAGNGGKVRPTVLVPGSAHIFSGTAAAYVYWNSCAECCCYGILSSPNGSIVQTFEVVLRIDS